MDFRQVSEGFTDKKFVRFTGWIQPDVVRYSQEGKDGWQLAVISYQLSVVSWLWVHP